MQPTSATGENNYSRASIPLHAGYFVYRLWSEDGQSLYVGKAGSRRGPVPVLQRLYRHAYEKSWWKPGIWADVRELNGYAEVMAEERAQIRSLQPVTTSTGFAAVS